MTDPKPARLVPTYTVWDTPDGVHLSVQSWNARLEAWLVGQAICGQTTEQSPLPDGTPVTCHICEAFREGYERGIDGRPSVEQEQLANLTAHLDLATEFHIPCPEAADPGRPEGAPVLQPEPLIVQKATSNWADLLPDGWRIFNPNLDMGDHVWTGDGWAYSGKLHMRVIYRWTRDQAITEAQRLAVEETRRYEAWLADMRAGAEEQ